MLLQLNFLRGFETAFCSCCFEVASMDLPPEEQQGCPTSEDEYCKRQMEREQAAEVARKAVRTEQVAFRWQCLFERIRAKNDNFQFEIVNVGGW